MNARTILALAPGSTHLHFSEFRARGTDLTLLSSGSLPLSADGTPPANRETSLVEAFRSLAKSGKVQGRHICLSIPASQVFTRFIRLPKVEALKVKQMMYFEARQNLPFPPEQMVWDFQALGSNSANESEYLLVGTKPESVEALFRAAEAAGYQIELLDIPQAALANAWKFNYPNLSGCSLLVEIGARNTNLLFFHDDQFYCRTLPIGSHSLTQEFVAETRWPVAKAEQFKIDQGFIHPGGAIVLSESDDQMLFSKLARQWVTRLHQQIAQTIQHYRTQAGGKSPERIFLAGLGASLGGIEEFFGEKFRIPVDMFQPFQKVSLDPALEATGVPRGEHGRGETVGMALRVVANCPFELNLVPKAIKAKKAWNQKKPYLFAATVCLLGSLLGTGYFYSEIAKLKRESLAMIAPKLAKLEERTNQLARERNALSKTKAEVDQLTALLNERFLWADALTDMQQALLKAEAENSEPGKPAGVWIESLKPAGAAEEESAAGESTEPTVSTFPEYLRGNPELWKRYFPKEYQEMMGRGRPQFTDGNPAPKTKVDSQQYTLLLRAVNLNNPKDSSRNGKLAYDVQDAFTQKERFQSENTKLKNIFEQVSEDAVTFTFGMGLEISPYYKK